MGSPRESQYVTGEYASGASKESTIAGTRSASIQTPFASIATYAYATFAPATRMYRVYLCYCLYPPMLAPGQMLCVMLKLSL